MDGIEIYFLIWNLFIQAGIIWGGVMLILYVSPVWVTSPSKHLVDLQNL